MSGKQGLRSPRNARLVNLENGARLHDQVYAPSPARAITHRATSFSLAAYRRGFKPMLTLIGIILIAISITGCSLSLCRDQAVKYADHYAAQGYEVRIIAYDLTLPGRAYSAFVFDFHAQAQVSQEGKWLYVSGLANRPYLRDVADFETKRINVIYELDEFKQRLQEKSNARNR